MTPTVVLSCVLLMACGGTPTAEVASLGNVGGSEAGILAAARAAERGRNGPRDYARAATLYRQLCADGSGELAACAGLADALAAGRGVARDVRRLIALYNVMCDRGDASACVQHKAMVAVMQRGSTEKMKQRLASAWAAVERACDAGDGRACEVRARRRGGDGGDGGAAERDRRAWHGIACKAGRFEACGQLTVELQLCDDEPGADFAPCVAHILEAWRDNTYDKDRLAADETLRHACSDGDAIACRFVPGHSVPLADLCTAHDYAACWQLGCIGDEAAAELADMHGVSRGGDCHAAGEQAMRDWLRAPASSRSKYAPIAADNRVSIGAQAAKPFEAVRFTPRGGRDARGWPRFSVYNMNDRAVTELAVCLYAYDSGARQLQRVLVTLPRISVAPNAMVPLELHGLIAEHLDEATAEVQVDYAHVRFAGDPAGSDAPARCRPTRELVPQPATMTW